MIIFGAFIWKTQHIFYKMPFYGKIKRTYSKKEEKIPAISNGLSFLDEHGKENRNHINRNSSLEESFWKDSFDKLLDDKQ